MAIRLGEVMTGALWIILAAIAFFSFCGTLGCKAYMQDDAKFEVGFKTMLTFEQVGPANKGDRSEMGFDAQEWIKKPAVEWFIDSDGDDVFDQSGELEEE